MIQLHWRRRRTKNCIQSIFLRQKQRERNGRCNKQSASARSGFACILVSVETSCFSSRLYPKESQEESKSVVDVDGSFCVRMRMWVKEKKKQRKEQANFQSQATGVNPRRQTRDEWGKEGRKRKHGQSLSYHESDGLCISWHTARTKRQSYITNRETADAMRRSMFLLIRDFNWNLWLTPNVRCTQESTFYPRQRRNLCDSMMMMMLLFLLPMTVFTYLLSCSSWWNILMPIPGYIRYILSASSSLKIN